MRRHLNKINETLRWFLRYARRLKYQNELNIIKKKNPQLFNKIDSAVEKKHKEYWSRLGTHINPSWLRVGANISGVNNYKIIPSDIYHSIVERILNNANYSEYESDKNYYERYLTKKLFPKVFIRKNLGQFLDREYNFISKKEATKIFMRLKQDLIVKPTVDTHSGNNVQKINYENGEFHYFNNNIDPLHKKKNRLKITFEEIDQRWGNNYVIQEVLKSDNFFSQFNKSSLNTLRIHTYRSVENDKISILYTIIRLGRKGSVIDNADSGGIFCMVDNFGNLNEYGLSSKGDKYYEHPDSKIKFKGLKVPYYKKAIQEAERIALKMPAQRLIGIDIAICPKGKIKVIELNLLGIGIYVMQIYGYPLFGKYTDEVIDYCIKNRHKDDFKVVRV